MGVRAWDVRGRHGTSGRTEWQRTLDLNVAYKSQWAEGHLTVKMDEYNVFDDHAVTSVIEQGENSQR